MSKVGIPYKGIIYPSTENFYQAMKYDEGDYLNPYNDGVMNVRKYISLLRPERSKQFSRDNFMTSTKFEENKLEIMRYAQRQKYRQEPFRSKLLATGDAYLEEGNWWGDRFWGCDIKTREGENNLGKIIMEVRNEIQG